MAAIATTPAGIQTLRAFCQSTQTSLWVPSSLAEAVETQGFGFLQVFSGSLKPHLERLWRSHHGFVFSMATGAVVRLVSSLLQDKSTDPAVIVVDEAGQFVISLCGGHQGGADQLTRLVALQLRATPVLTGAANHLGLLGVDVMGEPFGWQRGSGDWTGVSAAIARRATVQVIQEAGSTLWQEHLPQTHAFEFGFPESVGSQQPATNQPPIAPPAGRIWISPIRRQFSSASDFPKVQWHPRVLWVGIGCERGTSCQVIEMAVQQVCDAHHLAELAIAGVATIDLKADEIGLLEFCSDRNFPLKCFSAEQLRAISVPNPSAVVEHEVGTPSVAEAAAILACATPDALLRAAKQIVRLEGEPGAVTLAIAQSSQEYTGRTGRLWLVGTGPGQLDQITPAAQMAIAQADVVIGYSLYVELVASLLRPGQIVEALPITQERRRAERAIELAEWGLTVAVISSGDCGIYGMAGLVLEQLQTQGWDGKSPAVQVFPGITALQAAASRVGAPLMHDFCAISLSDLLTPWEVIEKRLTAAAQADFVVALYNPRSQTRTEQIAIAQQIFLNYRSSDTPVALVRSAYRQDEQITLTTLGQLLETALDMLTTVLIGNQSTRIHTDWMITPRGYISTPIPPA
jgi:cobalt-precorrin 5A hydrolase / precorrin-3B C17-methyltransferase